MTSHNELTAQPTHEAEGADQVVESKDAYGITEAVDEKSTTHRQHAFPGSVVQAKVAEYCGIKLGDTRDAPNADLALMTQLILDMSEEDALDILTTAIDFHKDDFNFPSLTMAKIKTLVSGYKAADMEEAEWLFELKTEASVIHYHSPYPEVRSVTSPFDDPSTPVETPRAYLLGLCFMAGATALNTFFSPRQPAIGVGSTVLSLLLAPCGLFAARVLPDWGFTHRSTRISLNPGPWTYKEQVFATIMFTIASGPGGVYYVYLVQKLPQYLGLGWVTFGYEIMLALSTQFFGFGFAGLLRRFVVYPVTSIWPHVLPTLALNRALVVPEPRGQVVNGWKITRYRFFLSCFGAMFCWYWVPNTLFTALRGFNWMTWISPNNFNLAMITGFYGGLGYNPWATFDWNVSGTGMLVTPFFSALQQYAARAVSGMIIIGMYWSNWIWSAYTPINSNEAFANDGTIYNVTRILGEDGMIDIEAYKQYGPPYFSGANVLGSGGWYAWYPMALFYIGIRFWVPLSKGFKGMWRSIRYRASIWDDSHDSHSRMMKQYPEVPDWWFGVVLLITFAIGVAAIKAWPTQTPWWTLLAVIGLSGIMLIPSAILQSTANVGMGFNVLFQTLAGVWFPGNPEAEIIVTAFGQNFNGQADTYMSDQKLAHYAKLPPRAIFRAQMLSAFLNCFIFIGMLNWMVDNFDNGSLCTWDNKSHFVCTDAVLVFASAIEYGAFGVTNFFTLYPILPWCFLIGTIVGITWGIGHRFGASIRYWCQDRLTERRFELVDRWIFTPISWIGVINPAIAYGGVLNWTGGNNLSYATNGMYISFIFMYHIKRRYGAWWEKYNYLLEAGFDVGVAVSAIVQTLAFQFGPPVSLNWWGNTVATAGVDYLSYNQKAPLLPIPEVGYFGLPPDQYPMHF